MCGITCSSVTSVLIFSIIFFQLQPATKLSILPFLLLHIVDCPRIYPMKTGLPPTWQLACMTMQRSPSEKLLTHGVRKRKRGPRSLTARQAGSCAHHTSIRARRRMCVCAWAHPVESICMHACVARVANWIHAYGYRCTPSIRNVRHFSLF